MHHREGPTVQDDLAILTLSQPERRNPQSPLLWTSLRRAMNDLPGSVRAVLIQGAGRSFSIGLDRSQLGDGGAMNTLAHADPASADAILASHQDFFAALRRPGLVSLALVQGQAVGAGFQLALACDFRIAAADAQFEMDETSLGLVPDLGATKRLVELIGYSRALELCLTGRSIGAVEAQQIGLVNSVVPTDELTDAGRALVSSVLARGRGAITETKALLLSAADNSADEQERAERHAQLRQLRDLMNVIAEDSGGAPSPSQ